MRKIAKTGLVLTLLLGATAILATNTARADLTGVNVQPAGATPAAPSTLSKMFPSANPIPTPGALVLFAFGTLLVATTQRKFAGH